MFATRRASGQGPTPQEADGQERARIEDPQEQAWMAINAQGRRVRRLRLKDINKKCWICMVEEGEEDQLVKRPNDWIHPCKCSLIAHAECLADWIGSSRIQNLDSKVTCPQCKTRYTIQEDWYPLVSLNTTLHKASNYLVPAVVVSGGTCALIVSCIVYGMFAIGEVMGPEEIEALLGQTDEWPARTWIGIPSIPFLLIFSRINAFDDVLLWLPAVLLIPRTESPRDFILSRDRHLPDLKKHPPPPWAITLALPYIRAAYNYLWKKFIMPHEIRWKVEIDPTLRLAVLDRTLQQAANALAQAQPQIQQLQNNNGNNIANGERGNIQNANANNRDINRPEIRIDLEKSFVHSVVGALAFPTLSAMAGSLLNFIPFIRNNLPQGRFYRSILGGCLIVILKDAFHLITLRQRVLQKRSRRIKSIDYIEEVVD